MNRGLPLFAAAWLVSNGCFAAPNDAPSDPPGLVRLSAEQQKTIKLQTVRVARMEITEPVIVAGTVVFDQGHVAVLRPLAQARVVRLLAQPGDRVKAGQTLAEFDLPSLTVAQTNLVAAQGGVREADAGLAVARDALRRGEILARDGSLARAEAERRRLLVVQADAVAQSARSRASAAQAEVVRLAPGAAPGISLLTSPIDGVIADSGLTPGELTQSTQTAFTVADLSVVLVLAQLPEASVPLVAVGDPARVSLVAGGERRWTGAIVSLGAAIDAQTRMLPARIQVANGDSALRAGMFVTIKLSSDRGRQGLVMPASAVQSVADKSVAFTVLGDGRFQSHELTLGVQRADTVEVRSGLNAGAEVVTQGSFELKAALQQSLLGGG